MFSRGISSSPRCNLNQLVRTTASSRRQSRKKTMGVRRVKFEDLGFVHRTRVVCSFKPSPDSGGTSGCDDVVVEVVNLESGSVVE